MNPHYQNSYRRFLLLFSGGLFSLFTPCFSQLNIEWERTFGGTGWEEIYGIDKTSDGGYIFGGLTTSKDVVAGTEISHPTKDTVKWPEEEGDFWVIKTDGNGNPVWDKRYGGFAQDRLWKIRELPDGGFIIAGESKSGIGNDHSDLSRGGVDWWIIRTDPSGNIIWEKTYGGAGNDFIRAILPLPQGGYLLGGYSFSDAGNEKSENSRGNEDFWVMRIDGNGNKIWDKTIGGAGGDQLFDMEMANGGFLLAGYSTSNISGEKTEASFGANDMWIVKIDGNGNIRWQKTIGGSGSDVCQRVTRTLDNQYMLSGQSNSPDSGNKTTPNYGSEDGWLVKIRDNDASASILWQKTYGGSAGDYLYAVAQNSLGNYFVVGISFSLPDSVSMVGNKSAATYGSGDYWVLYLDKDGNKIWDQSLGGIQNDKGELIIPAHEYGFIIAGTSASTVSPPFKSQPSRGGNDQWIIRTGCVFDAPVLPDLPKICRDEVVSLDATVNPCDFCEYFWSDGGEGPQRDFSPDSTLQVKVLVLHPDGCTREDSSIIEIVPGPEALVTDIEPVSCFGESDGEFFIEEVLGGAPPYLFSLNGGDWEESAHYVRLPPGTYNLSLLDANGCLLDTSFYMDQPEEVLVELGDDIYVTLGDSVQLQALTNQLDSFSFEWLQPNIISCDTCMEPWARPFLTTVVAIRLTDKNGCAADDHLRLIVGKNDEVYAPNVFSPNDDNVNDFFTIYADQAVTKINTLMIFDRWGEKMFERKDFPPNVEQLGWNGELDGKPMKPAVFVWWAEVEYVDGRTGFFEGGVTLLR
jgi:gliding motility-associated-like protein